MLGPEVRRAAGNCIEVQVGALGQLGSVALELRAQALQENNPKAYQARSTLEYASDPPAGMRDIERAISLSPRDPEFHRSRGWQLAGELPGVRRVPHSRPAWTAQPDP